jgi:sporulation protein YlmC with PRC-barrel domain
MYGMNIYDQSGAFLGKAYDVILNLHKGEVVRITTEPLKHLSKTKEDMTKMLQKKSILFKRVKSLKDIIVVGR